MRILGIGTCCDLGAMYLQLAEAGHDVRVFIEDFAESGIMDGLLERVSDWRAALPWVRDAGCDGVIVFESADRGEEQDRLRAEGYQVIGGCAEGDRLENDRHYAQRVLADLGMAILPCHAFSDFDDAIAHVTAHPDRYVFKLDGSATAAWRNYVGQRHDGRDMI